MLKGKTYVAKDGIEFFMCLFTDMYITQSSMSAFSHKGIMANDVRGKSAGVKYPYYAPCTCKCIRTYPSAGQVMWQSTSKVRFANGRIDYATFMTVHDNSMDAKVGMIVKQGQQLGNMGNKGNATGVHCHIEVSQSSDTTWTKNQYGIYHFNNEYDLDDCYFVDDTNILYGMGGNWRKTSSIVIEPVDDCKEKREELNRIVQEKSKEIDNLKSELESKDEYIKDLQEENNLNNGIIATLNGNNKALEDKVVQLSKELENKPKQVFKCVKTGMYKIKLYENENLFIG